MKLLKQKTPADGATHLAQEVGIEADNFLHYRRPHAARVAALSEEIAQLFCLGNEDRLALRTAALVHDAGLLAMRRDYIAHRAELTFDERLDLARHAVVGEGEAARLGLGRGAQLLIRWHHERWNGGGYPDGLRGEQIPLPARILRLAETYCALIDARPWRDAYTREEALSHIFAGAGMEFDPHVVYLFSRIPIHAALDSHASPPRAAETTMMVTSDSQATVAPETLFR